MTLLDRFLDREVTVVTISDSGADDYGNEVASESGTFTTRARREQLSATEDIMDRDQQARTFVYFFRPDVVITGRDRIHDDTLTLEVLGAPDVVEQKNRPHHLEVRAYVIEG